MNVAQFERLMVVMQEGNRVQAELAAQVAELSERVVLLLEIMVDPEEEADPDAQPTLDMAGRPIAAYD